MLGKRAPLVALRQLPAKPRNDRLGVTEDRCHVAIWTAWLASLPSVMRAVGLGGIVVFVYRCPNIGEQRYAIQTSVADSTSLATLGRQPLASSLKNINRQKKLSAKMNHVQYQNTLDAHVQPRKGFTQASCCSICGTIPAGSSRCYILDAKCSLCTPPPSFVD